MLRFSRSLLAYSVIVAAAGTSACLPDLTERNAAETIHAHLTATDGRWGDSAIDAVEVIVDEILRADDDNHEVRFRLAEGADTSQVERMFLTRSRDGWAVSSYGSGTVEMVAAIILNRRWGLYEDLMGTLRDLEAARDNWVESSDPLVAIQRLGSVPPLAELKKRIVADSIPGSVEWGVYPDREPVLLWVRESSDEGRVCAVAYTSRYVPGEYLWVVRDAAPNESRCRGATTDHHTVMLEEMKAKIVANGNIWLN